MQIRTILYQDIKTLINYELLMILETLSSAYSLFQRVAQVEENNHFFSHHFLLEFIHSFSYVQLRLMHFMHMTEIKDNV